MADALPDVVAQLRAEDTDLVLEADEVRALQIFHRSFNLPGLRFGLVNVVCQDDHFPPEDTQIASPDAHVQQSSPGVHVTHVVPETSVPETSVADETSALLAYADGLLGPADEIVEEMIEPVPCRQTNSVHR